MAQLVNGRKGVIVAWARWLVAILVLLFVVRSFFGAQRTLAEQGGFTLRQLQVRWLVVAGCIYFLALLPMGCYWILLLRRMGQPIGWYRGMTAYYVGHLGKYVPGKAMVVVLRAGLLGSARTNLTVAATSVFIETFTMMAVGAGLASALIAWQFGEYRGLL
ncbi:MAG: flippase-like domain-containing protein, partial [Planctomycetaceae bacterium]|nr:flippase-like domain-containing protein [Planctomycetaceae bacterium]